MITIDQNTCKRCGLCAEVCSLNLIAFRKNNWPRKVPGFDQMCLKCGHCVAICPTGSLTHKDIPQEKCSAIKPELRISEAQSEQFIRARRSIREYKDQPVPRDLIQRLINIAHYAPTGHNNQDVEWLVIDDKDTLLNIEKAGIGWIREGIEHQSQLSRLFNLPAMLVKQEKELNSFLRGAPVLICATSSLNQSMALIDCTIAMTTLELAATSLGLGGCWAGMVYMMASTYPPVHQAIGLPPSQTAHAVMVVGYPKYQYIRMVERKPAPITWLSSEARGN
jgi:nitroreductase/NAD-dependent dihydropyrimidine dehydrogenase PreA subunit